MNLDNMMNIALQHYINEESKKLQIEVIAILLSKVFVERVPPNKREQALDNAIARVKKESYKDSENYDEVFLEVLGNAKGLLWTCLPKVISNMSKAITRLSTWHNTGEDENYYIGGIYISDCGVAVICATSKDTGYYNEWFLQDFYKEFTFISEESL